MYLGDKLPGIYLEILNQRSKTKNVRRKKSNLIISVPASVCICIDPPAAVVEIHYSAHTVAASPPPSALLGAPAGSCRSCSAARSPGRSRRCRSTVSPPPGCDLHSRPTHTAACPGPGCSPHDDTRQQSVTKKKPTQF